ncbi:uncharacterized protein NECHADRAFT_81624 [Fusarium vanettenii 77-13-4]|uniref:Uncharacterized protein n=1 Tax=Fusarium vanettenii (strain ATCC MYA-4622 / CBS 123669 / FGSC 9596 / NRRL 45880 / 77-13-4) TaxID=660122 RepID=C7Z8T6_FUSV7|nr:uncharacterized protein NECHADRAFT_81624 [Fusarium vanettenii 77-13-4]EEU39028.1 predicted protein [Fusarium vanettenii 77-13-4]
MASTMEDSEVAHFDIIWWDLLPYMGIWMPNTVAVFENFENANFFGRFNTWHSAKEIREAIEVTPSVDHSFCLFLDSTILVFSATREDHFRHMNQVGFMLQDLFMGHDRLNCVCFAPTTIRAGCTIEPLGRAFIVIDVGAYIRSNGLRYTSEEN